MGLPTVARTMGHVSRWSVKKSSVKKKIVFILWERNRLLRVNCIHTTSDAEAQEVRELLNNEVSTATIPLGIRVPEFAEISKSEARKILGLNEKDKIIVFLSRLDPKKRIEKVFNVLKKIRDCKLIIAGAGSNSYENYLRRLATCLGIDARITWYGWADEINRWRILKAADVFVLPSLSENFGLAALEAAACGVPVVLSRGVDVGRRLSELGAAKICFNDHSYEEFVNEILNAPNKYEFDFNYIRSEFNWVHTAERLKELYMNILKSV